MYTYQDKSEFLVSFKIKLNIKSQILEYIINEYAIVHRVVKFEFTIYTV